jgi:hypothetical protein
MKGAVYEPSFAEHFGVFYCTQLARCFKLGSENAKRMACGRNLRRNSKRFYPFDDLIPDGILSDFGFYASERGSVLAPFRVTGGSELVVLHSLLLIGVNQYRRLEN